MGCIAANINLTIYEGGTFDQLFQWKTGTPETVVDLTGYTAKMNIRAKLISIAEIINIQTALSLWVADGNSGIYFDDAADGKYRIYINDTDTTGICPAYKDIAGVYDLFLYSPAGEAVLKQYGVCTLKAAVTR